MEQEISKLCLGIIQTNGGTLNVRSLPNYDSSSVCGSLDNQMQVNIIDNEEVNDFIKINGDVCGLNEAYVHKNYISQDCNSQVVIDRKPDQVNEDQPSLPAENIILSADEFINRYMPRINVYRRVTRNGPFANMTLYRYPSTGEKMLCGMKHIRSYRSSPYVGKDTSCAVTSFAQEWRKTICKNNDSHCKIMMGDLSFGTTQPSSWPHSTHRRGWCMDIWPMRKQGCGEQELTWRSSCYSRSLTQSFVNLLIKHGADAGNQLFFNDPEIKETRYLSNHDDHIHVCFKPSNSIVKNSCSRLQIDSRVCPVRSN